MPTIVTLSRPADTPPLTTYAAYEIRVTNNSTNPKNRVRLVGTTTVAGAPLQIAPFVASIGLSCVTTNATSTSIECAIGQLRGGGGASAFVVIFQAPVQGLQSTSTGLISTAKARTTAARTQDTNAGQAVTILGTPIATELKTYVPPTGGTFFTGATGVATG